MGDLSLKEALEEFIKTKPEEIYIGEIDTKETTDLIDPVSTGHSISHEDYKEICERTRDEMLSLAFKTKDKDLVKLIEGIRRIDTELEKYNINNHKKEEFSCQK